MATANLYDFLRRLQRGMAAEMLGDNSDRQLVERALAARDGAAFQAILHRHGPMVYRVCWRVLQHAQDAEDAFQATFLVLAQKLHTVRKHASLASWLHGVAHRLALKAKAQAVARRCRERQASLPDTLPPDDATWGELRVALDFELSQLPDKWRLPLILCYLEGRTQDESAKQLEWSKSTLRRRLEEARTALHGRLSGRGIVWPAALSAVLVSDCLASAAAAPGLVASTVEAAAGVAAGKTVATVASAKIAALTEGVLKTMFLTKLKMATAVLFCISLVAVGIGGFSYTTFVKAQAENAQETQANPMETPPEEAPPLRVEKEQENAAKAQQRTGIFVDVDAENNGIQKAAKQPVLPGAKVLAAWEEAGAEFGWFWVGRFGFPEWHSGRNQPGAGDRPAFRFKQFPTGKLLSLPGPEAAFGLWLQGTKATDEDLKELAALKQLRTLSLKGTKVTDAGLKELAKLGQLHTLYLGFTQVTDAGLKDLAELKQLQTLDLRQTKVTDAGFKELARLKKLQKLFLGMNNNVTDAGMKELARLKQLQFLGLWQTQVTDVGLKELAALPQLQSLGLMRTQVTDVGLKELAGLQQLQELNLGQTQVTDAARHELAGLKNLRWLNLSGTKITDASLKELGGLKQLRKLELGQTQVTDAGLKELAGLKQLLLLDLSKTRVTDAGVDELQKALPQMSIKR